MDFRANQDDVVVRWCDNKARKMTCDFPLFAGIEPAQRENPKHVHRTVPRPVIVETYQFMGGVDLLDTLSARHKFGFKSWRRYIYIWWQSVFWCERGCYWWFPIVGKSAEMQASCQQTFAVFHILHKLFNIDYTEDDADSRRPHDTLMLLWQWPCFQKKLSTVRLLPLEWWRPTGRSATMPVYPAGDLSDLLFAVYFLFTTSPPAPSLVRILAQSVNSPPSPVHSVVITTCQLGGGSPRLSFWNYLPVSHLLNI